MPSYANPATASNPYAPIVSPALRQKLTPIEGGSLSCNDLCVWTLIRRYSCAAVDVQTLLPARLTPDREGVYTTLFLDTIQVALLKAEAIVTLTYKGAIGSFGPPIGEAATHLQSGSFTLTDATYSAGTYPTITDPNQTISCFYYSPQTTWRWAQSTYPEAPITTAIAASSLPISPFNSSPINVGVSSLNCSAVPQVTDFTVRAVAAHYECTATIAVTLVAKDISLIDGVPDNADSGGGLTTGGLSTGGL